MNYQTVFFASYEVILSLVFGLFTIFVCTKVLNWSFLKSRSGNLLLESNSAASIFAGAMIFSVLVLVHGAILPSVDALRTMALGKGEAGFSVILISLGYFLVFYVIALVISIAVIFFTTQIYLIATINIDEMNEIRRNNIAVAILLSAILLGMTFFIQPAVQRFIGSLVNYEFLERVEVEEHPQVDMREGETIVPEQRMRPE